MNIEYYVSGRGKLPEENIITYLNKYYPEIQGNIKSVYGFLEKSKLYGGRSFIRPDFTNDDILNLYKNNIGLEIPLTSQHCVESDFYSNKELLETINIKGNMVTCYNDKLAYFIKKNYTNLKIKLSVTKVLLTIDDINNIPDIYDYVVIHPIFNNNKRFLDKIINKDKAILFGACGCIATCNNSTCYTEISKKNYYDIPIYNICNKENNGTVDKVKFTKYDINKFIDMGFSKFKINRENVNSIKKAY